MATDEPYPHPAMPPRYAIRLLGEFSVTAPDGQPVVLPGRKSESLLALLCLEPGRALSRESLAEILWPHLELNSKQTRLRQEIATLRRHVGEILDIAHTTIAVHADRVDTDLARFREALRCGNLADAVARYGGELLAGRDDLCDSERRTTARAFEDALWKLAERRRQSGALEESAALLERLVGVDPLREEAHAALMRLWAALGQPGRVVRQYQELERALDTALGEAPSSAVRELVQTLREAAPAPVAAPGPAPAPIAPPPARPRRRPLWLAAIACAPILLLAMRPAPEPTPIPYAAYRDVPSPDEEANSEGKAAVEIDGTVVVAGITQSKTEDADILTVALNPDGSIRWRQRYRGDGHDCDRAFAIQRAPDGGVFVGGESFVPARKGVAEGWRLLVLRYSLDGTLQWAWRAPEGMEDAHGVVRLATDGRGEVVVSSGKHPVVVQLTAAGRVRWRRTLESPTAGIDALAADANGEVYAASGGQVAALSGVDGSVRWQRGVTGTIGALLPDRYGAVSVCGSAGDALWVQRLAADTGEPRWEKRGSTVRPGLRFQSAAMGADGRRLALAGLFTRADGGVESVVAVYDDQGVPHWERPLSPTAPWRSIAAPHVLVDPHGRVFVGAQISTEAEFHLHVQGDQLLVRYTADGAVDTWRRIEGRVGETETVTAIAGLRNDGGAVLAGQGKQLGGAQFLQATFVPATPNER